MMLSKKYQERLQVLSGILTESTNKVYYHGSNKFVGDKILFKPKGFYEKIDKNNNPIFAFDEYELSNIPEISASKYIGGAILGCFSTKRTREIFIYTIHENPTVDISHWLGDDFEFLQEVRYRKPVQCIFYKKINISKNFF